MPKTQPTSSISCTTNDNPALLIRESETGNPGHWDSLTPRMAGVGVGFLGIQSSLWEGSHNIQSLDFKYKSSLYRFPLHGNFLDHSGRKTYRRQ